MLRNLTRGRKKYFVLPALTALIATGAMAFDLGDVLKGGLVGVAVEALAPTINKAINPLLMNSKAENRQETKVVPILTVGKGAKVGAAQVIGEKADVDKVKAVAQLEGSVSKIGFKALIPIESLDLTNLKRVYGVGLSALVDYKL